MYQWTKKLKFIKKNCMASRRKKKKDKNRTFEELIIIHVKKKN